MLVSVLKSLIFFCLLQLLLKQNQHQCWCLLHLSRSEILVLVKKNMYLLKKYFLGFNTYIFFPNWLLNRTNINVGVCCICIYHTEFVLILNQNQRECWFWGKSRINSLVGPAEVLGPFQIWGKMTRSVEQNHQFCIRNDISRRRTFSSSS